MTAFKYIGKQRRVVEDRRFVSGAARFAADYLPEGTLHVALVSSDVPAAMIDAIDLGDARAMPGVVDVVTGDELSRAISPLMSGLTVPEVKRYPLAVGQIRYAGEWVAAVVAETRAEAEDAAELVEVAGTPLTFVLDAEDAYAGATPVHPSHGSNVLLDKTFDWGPVEDDFASAAHRLDYRVVWGRSSTVPIETFGLVASWDPWREILEIWASVQMPKYADQIARALKIPANQVKVHQDVDVGGSYGVKRGIKHTVLASYLTRKLARPVRLIEDRLENMAGGDQQGPERIFDVSLAFEDDGLIRSMKMRALDNVGAYAGRAPFQLGKPIGAIVGAYTINSVQYQAISVTTNKATQEAVRGFGQAPTNYAIETGIDKVASALGLDRLQVRRRNFIKADQFPYLIPSGTHYDSGDYHSVLNKVLAAADWDALIAKRNGLRAAGQTAMRLPTGEFPGKDVELSGRAIRMRAAGQMAGIGLSTCLEPSGGNSSFEPLLNPDNTTTTWMESCRINVDGVGDVTATIHTTSSGQGHETLTATVIGEVLGIDPARIRIARPDSSTSLPGNSPVGSRMAVMLGGAAHNAAKKLIAKLERIGAHLLGGPAVYTDGNVNGPNGTLGWADLVDIAHRRFHDLPVGEEPGLQAADVYQVPTGGDLPVDGRVQMYPCHSFECHCVLLSFDPALGKPEIHRYVIGHDCGTEINPDIVRGMTLGGIAHGIGAALMEEFSYNSDGQMVASSLMDYLLPSAHEVPAIEIVKHCTPSPHTVFGQKGSGESGYLGAPAAIASAINDALSPLGVTADRLPIRMSALSDLIAERR